MYDDKNIIGLHIRSMATLCVRALYESAAVSQARPYRYENMMREGS